MGPPITRWFDEDIPSTSLITTATRQRYVPLIFPEDDEAVVIILNFNQNYVRLARVCGLENASTYRWDERGR